MAVTIKSIDAIEALDSRGNPTVSVEVVLSDMSRGHVTVPSGVSTGEFEAAELRDADIERFGGKGVISAVKNVNDEIAPKLIGVDPFNQSEVDSVLIELDGTENKSRLGANAVLGVSFGIALAAADSLDEEMFRYLADQEDYILPSPLVNVINGGAHADNGLDVQEFQLVPVGAESFSHAVRICSEIFHALGELLHDDGYQTSVGDEGGYAPRFETMELAFDFLMRAIEKANYSAGDEVAIGLDIAASELVEAEDEKYFYRFVRSSGKRYTSADLIGLYEEWMAYYPIVSIEDGLGENDWYGWKDLTDRLGSKVQLVGDDLFATNASRLTQGIQTGIANSVIVKPNQIGTLTETLEVIKLAKEAKYRNIISHRSGESIDSFIADLAVASGAGQIKTGSMSRGERIAKYNRLLWIEHKLGDRAQFSNVFKNYVR